MTHRDVLAYYGMSKEGRSIFERIVNAILMGRFRYKRFLNKYDLYHGWAIQTKEIPTENGETTYQLWFRVSDMPLIEWYSDSKDMYFL